MAAHKENLQLLIGAKDKASPILNKVKGAVIGIGAAYLGWQGVKNIIGGIVSAGIASEKAWTDVAASLERHNYAVDEGLKSVQAFSSALQDQTGISDELAGISVQMLLDYNNDLATSFDMVKVAADMAAGAHMDMKSAVDLLGKASVGYTSALSRYGIIIDDSIPKSEKFAEVIKQINARFGGAAAARMETSAAKLSLLSETIGDFREKLFFLFSSDLISSIDLAINSIKGFARVLDLFTGKIYKVDIEIGIDEAQVQSTFKQITESLANLDFVLEYMGIQAGLFWAKLLGQKGQVAALEAELEALSTRVATRWVEEWTSAQMTIKNGFLSISNESQDTANAIIDHAAQVAENKMMHFEATLTMLDGEKTKTIEMWGELLDELEEESMEASLAQFENLSDNLKKRLAIYDEEAAAAEEMYREVVYMAKAAVGSTLDAWIVGRIGLKEVFQQIGRDYFKFFVKQILKDTSEKLIPDLLDSLSMFDRTANDRMAMTQGQHYAEFFISGAMGTFRQANFGQQIARAATPSYDIDELGVELVKNSQRGFSNLAFREDFLTENI